MPDLDETVASIRKHMDKKQDVREGALSSSREIVRLCKGVVFMIHNDEDPWGDLEKANLKYRDLKNTISDFPELSHSGYILTAEQELSEAEILARIIFDRELPTPQEIGVSEEGFLMGLADSIGEMRRAFLSRLMKNEIGPAKDLIDEMENFFSMLMNFDYPEALINIRRKQDVARNLLEKCRGELVLATQMKRLGEELSKRA